MKLLDVLNVVCKEYSRIVRGAEPRECFSKVKYAFDGYHAFHGEVLEFAVDDLIENERFLAYVCDKVDISYTRVEYAGRHYAQSTILRALHEYEVRYHNEDDPMLDENGMTALQRLASRNYVPVYLEAESLKKLCTHMKALDEWMMATNLDSLEPQDIHSALYLMDNVRLRAYVWMPDDHLFVDVKL